MIPPQGGISSCSPTHSFYKVLPKPQLWGAPGLCAWAGDELCWMPGRTQTGWEAGTGMCSTAGDQLLQRSLSEVVLGMAPFSWEKLPAEVCLLPSTLQLGMETFQDADRSRMLRDIWVNESHCSGCWLLTFLQTFMGAQCHPQAFIRAGRSTGAWAKRREWMSHSFCLSLQQPHREGVSVGAGI